MIAARTKKSESPKFENRVRFNWGYHDAANAVKCGWNTVEKNFGFGPSLNITCVADVLEQHFDSSYAQGWQQGYFDAEDGTYDNSSESAWLLCKAAGTVSE